MIRVQDTKSLNKLTCHPHQRAGDVRIWTEPERAEIVAGGVQTIYGHVLLEVRPSEVQKVDHIFCHGAVVVLVVDIPESVIGLLETFDIWRVCYGERKLAVVAHGGL